jgi:uncharacterized protein YjiK
MQRFNRFAASTCMAVCLFVGTFQSAAAQTSIGLQNYVLTGNYALETLGGRGLEASAVTYARDRGTLFFVGDEGLGVVEITRTGETVGSMAFSGWPAASSNRDAEGLAYLGSGVLVVAEERLQDAFRFDYIAGGSVNLANAAFVSIGADTGNTGIEGIAVDPRNGSFLSVKQAGPQNVLAGNLTLLAHRLAAHRRCCRCSTRLCWAWPRCPTWQAWVVSTRSLPRRPATNLLILSLDSRRLVETNRQGQVLSSLDLSGFTAQAIEGLTVDEAGTLYLVAESNGALPSRLLVLSPVPEPGSLALMVAGLLGVACVRGRSAANANRAAAARTGVGRST